MSKNHLEITTGETSYDVVIKLNGQELKNVTELTMRLAPHQMVIAVLSLVAEVNLDAKALVLATADSISEAEDKLRGRAPARTRHEVMEAAADALVAEFRAQGIDPELWDNLGDGESITYLGADGNPTINLGIIVDAVAAALHGVTISDKEPVRLYAPSPGVEVPGKVEYAIEGWAAIDDRLPRPGRDHPVVWRGPSGYGEPHETMEISGYYDPDHRPRNPYLTWAGDAVSDYTGITPTHWRPRFILE